MQKYNIFQALVMSFYSGDLYRDVAKNWGGKAFLYLLLLLALSWILFTFQVQRGLNLAYARDSDKFVSQIPVMTIKDGKLSTPERRPYLIKDPSSNEVIAIIDTTGQHTSLTDTKAGILVTETQIITQPKENETRTNQIPATVNLVVEPQKISGYIQKYLGFVWIFVFVFFTFFSYIYRIIQAILYAIIGKIFSGLIGAKLRFDQILPIAMVAITPAVVVATVIDFFNVIFPFQFLIYFLLALAYLFYGIIANKNQDTNG